MFRYRFVPTKIPVDDVHGIALDIVIDNERLRALIKTALFLFRERRDAIISSKRRQRKARRVGTYAYKKQEREKTNEKGSRKLKKTEKRTSFVTLAIRSLTRRTGRERSVLGIIEGRRRWKESLLAYKTVQSSRRLSLLRWSFPGALSFPLSLSFDFSG